MRNFNYQGWDLDAAVNALMNYDQGSTDSGVKDDAMKNAVRDHLKSLVYEDDPDFLGSRFDLWVSRFVRETYLTENCLRAGCGIDDVVAFFKWLLDEMGINLL